MTTRTANHVRDTKIIHSTFVAGKINVLTYLMKSVSTFDEKC